MAAMTLTSAISAQRHSPEATGETARSADDIFFIRGRKRSMSGQSSLTVELGDLSFNKKGGKFFPLRGRGARAPEWSSAEWLKILWHPSGFKDPDARRVSLSLEADEGVKTFFRGVEEHLVRSLAALSIKDSRLFGKPQTEAEVKERFLSCLKTNARCEAFVKTKMDWDKLRIWGPKGEVLKEPGELAGRECKVRCELRQVWLMTGQCGLLVEVTDLMLRESSNERCPFSNLASA